LERRPQHGVARAFVRSAALLSAALLFVAVLAACDGGDDGDSAPSAGTPPAGVPTAAVPAGEQEFGDIEPTPADAEEVRLYESLSCSADIMTIVTSQETVYALIPCDRSLPADVAGRFAGVPVRIRVTPERPPHKLYLESASQGTAEFTVDGVWIAPR
jgi:hypothetical protein